jgi:hypothetical protein
MPDFKPFERQRSVPGVSGQVKGSIAGAGAEGEALAGVGRGIADAGTIIATQQEKLRQQDLTNQELTLKAAYNERQRAFSAQEKQYTGQDTFDNITRADDFVKKTNEELLKDITDPELRNRLNAYSFTKSESLKDALTVHQMDERQAVTKTASDNILNGLLKDSYDGGDLKDQLNDWADTIALQHQTGSIGQGDAITQTVEGEAKITEAYIDGLISRDPVMATEAIKSGQFDQYLPQEKIEEYDKKADTMSKALAKDLKAQAKEADRVAKEKKRELQKEIGNDFLDKLMDGGLTNTEILTSELDPTGENSKEHWLKQVKERNKKSTKEEWVTVPEVEADFITRITNDPNSVSDSDITDKQGDGLSTDDARGLISYRKTRIGKEDDPLKTEQAKASIKRIDDAKTGRVFSQDRVENSKQWAESTVLLKRFIVNNPEADPAEFVDQLLEPIETGFIDSVFDFFQPGTPNLDVVRQQQREALGIEAGAAPEVPEVRNIDTWLEQARTANPGVSDEELTAFYNDKYGNQ